MKKHTKYIYKGICNAVTGTTSRWILRAAAVVFICLAAISYAGAQYCISYATSSINSKCDAVLLKGNTSSINNNSSGSGCVTYTDYTGLPAADLTAGRTYSISITQGTCGVDNARSINAWIDFNRNNTFDASEVLGGASGSVSSATPGLQVKFTFTVPCSIVPGTTRLRVIVLEGATNTSACAVYSYGETEDYNVKLLLPSTISANFIAPSNVFVNTMNRFIASSRSNVSYDWDADVNGYNYISPSTPVPNPDYPDFKFSWNTTGLKCVKLRSGNCVGKDSVINCFNVVAPTKVPTADFITSASVVEEYNFAQLFDMSSDGPTIWAWDVYDSTDLTDIKNTNSGSVVWTTSPLTQNPIVQFYDQGCYTVELTSKNSVGTSVKKRKLCYIKVVPATQYFLCYGPTKTESATGTVYDNGGPNQNYTTVSANRGCARLRITPCNAKTINLVFTQIRLAKNDHTIRVFDAAYANDPKLLYTVTNADRSKLPLKITATSGSMYIDFDGQSGSVDSGFAAYYTSELQSATPPVSSFSMESSPSYNRVRTRHVNTTTNIAGTPTYNWYVDDNLITDPTQLVDAGDGRIDLYYPYYTDGAHNTCLEVVSCAGTVKTCNSVNVITPNTPTALDFVASNLRPVVGDDVDLISMSDKADKFLWTIYPSGSYTLISGGTQISPGIVSGQRPKVKFNASGRYSFILTAWNSNDSVNTVNTVVKGKYVIVLEYCEPVSILLSSDISINRVILTDPSSNALIDNQTPGGLSGYSDYTPAKIARVSFGATYSLQVSRATAVNPANRQAWIDFNLDGDFDDAGEQVMNEASSTNLSNTVAFKVPPLKNAFEGTTRMRIAINYANNTTAPCGPAVAGEYEDYGIVMVNDHIAPVLTLNGPDTIRIEKCSPYTDQMATAIDPVEGDLSSTIVMTTELVDDCVPGIYTTEFNVEDAAGNKAAPVRRTIIVVLDKTKPVITVGGANPYYIEAKRDNPPYTEPAPVTAKDNTGGDITSAIVVSGSVDTRKLGTYLLVYSVKDVAQNQDIKNRTVIVQDTKAPEIISIGLEKIQINSPWIDQTAVADSFDNNPALTATAGAAGKVNTGKKGIYPISYLASDASGNIAGPIVRSYMVDDYIPPVITFTAPMGNVYYHDVNTPYTTQKPMRSDNYYDSASVSLILTNPNVVNPYLTGTYKEKWKALDPSGNVTYAERTVYVVDRIAPTLYATPIRACVESPINPFEGITITDNYYSPDDLLPLVEVVQSNVNQWQAGNYYIAYRVTDPAKNTSVLFNRPVEYTYWPACMNSLAVSNVKLDDAVTIFPNPNNGRFTISIKGNTNNGKVEVHNLLGALIKTETYSGNTLEMDMTAFANGMYLVKVYNGESVTIRKVTINR